MFGSPRDRCDSMTDGQRTILPFRELTPCSTFAPNTVDPSSALATARTVDQAEGLPCNLAYYANGVAWVAASS